MTNDLMLRFFLLVALPALLLAATPAAAQEPQGWLTVADALRLAEANSPELGRLRAAIAAKNGERRASYGIYAPQLSFAREGIPSAGGDFSEQRWVVGQTLDFPLQTYFRLQRVGAEEDALSYTAEAARRALRGRVKSAYTEVLYAQEMLHLGTQSVQLNASLREAVTQQVEVGAAAELDLMKVELQLSEAQSTLEERVRAYEAARYTLYHTIGIEPDDQVYGVAFPDTMGYRTIDVTQEEVLALLQEQPEIASADAAIHASQLGTKQVRSAALPQLGLNYWAHYFGGGYSFHGFEVGITLPLWYPLNNRGAVMQARARTQEQVWNRQEVSLNLKREIELAWHGYQTSKMTIDRYAETVQAQADELMERTREGYQFGQLDLLTLLDTQRTFLAAQTRFYDALRTYYLNLIRLERYLQRDLVFSD